MRRKQEGYLPFNDDKPKYAENPPFEASSLLVVKATANVKDCSMPFGRAMHDTNFRCLYL